MEKTIHIDGHILSEEMVTLSPRISGTVNSLEVEMGDLVKEGEVVLRMDKEPLELTFIQAKAAFLSAESTFTRLESLYNNQAATRQSYDEAQARYEAAKSQFELAQLNLEYADIVSPLTGAVLETHINRGALAGPGTPLVTLGNLDALKVEVRVPEQHYSLFLERQDTMEIFMNVPALEGAVVPLSIAAVASHINPETRSFLVKCIIPPAFLFTLRPGMFVQVGFVFDSRDDVFYLPFQAAAEGGTLWYIRSDGSADSLELKPDFANEDYFVIPDDWGGYQFILEGQHFLQIGKEVRIIDENRDSFE